MVQEIWHSIYLDGVYTCSSMQLSVGCSFEQLFFELSLRSAQRNISSAEVYVPCVELATIYHSTALALHGQFIISKAKQVFFDHHICKAPAFGTLLQKNLTDCGIIHNLTSSGSVISVAALFQ